MNAPGHAEAGSGFAGRRLGLEGITTAMIDELALFWWMLGAEGRGVGALGQAPGSEPPTGAEAITFKNAIKTLQELYHFQILRGRAQGLEEVDPVDLDAFLHGGAASAEVDQQECPAPVDVASTEAG